MMKVPRALISWVMSLAAATSANAACDTTLKPTDDYRALAGKLECLNSRIVALEKLVGSESPTAPKTPLNKSVSVKGGKLTAAHKECGWSQSNGDLLCSFLFQNQTVEDQTICLGTESRLVTDTNASYSKAGSYYARVGSKNIKVYGHESGDRVCDVVPPMTRAEAAIRFYGSKGQAKSRAAFVRLDCGADCQIDAFDVDIK